MNERIPFQATEASRAYDRLRELPVCLFLENIRSVYNVGSFFRTADAAAVKKLYLAGITAAPPHPGLAKTALGAEASVPWERAADPLGCLSQLRNERYEIAAVETSAHAVDLFDWRPTFPVCLLFGHETEGLSAETAGQADRHIRIPMLGMKHSLNVATAGGIVIYELLRKYRALG